MKKRVMRALITTIVVSSFIVTPVLATPSIEEIEQNKSQAEQAAGSVNDQLVSLLVQFDALKKDIDNQQVRIDQAAADYAAAQEKEKKQYNDMKLRIKYMYEEGDISFLEALFSAENYTDLVNKAEYVQKVHKYDRQKLEDYVATKEEVASLKEELESGQSEMEVMAQDYEAQQAALETTLADMRSRIADFDSQLAQAEAQAAAQMQQLTSETEAVVASAASGNAAQGNGNSGSTQTNNTSNGNNGGGSSSVQPAPDNNANQGGSNSGNSQGNNGGGQSGSSSGSNADSGSTSNTGKGQQIANTACGYVGNLSYVYGGTSLVSGADCSGFTQSIFRLYGITIPRTAEAQWAGWGRNVSYGEALPGDLVCYSGHVGIYIGNGKLVHASNPADGVKISNIGYRQWLGFKRYW